MTVIVFILLFIQTSPKNYYLRKAITSGHCEYFAAASVFLLRQAGIPARLANGYVVEEYNPEQNLYIVRSRHAHAWAIAYINGVWQIVDSTPSQWLEMENVWFSYLNLYKNNTMFVDFV